MLQNPYPGKPYFQGNQVNCLIIGGIKKGLSVTGLFSAEYAVKVKQPPLI